MKYSDLIYVTVRPKNCRSPFQNKVATRCNLSIEDPVEVAESVFNDICEMDRLNKNHCTFEVFVKFGDKYYKIEESC